MRKTVIAGRQNCFRVRAVRSNQLWGGHGFRVPPTVAKRAGFSRCGAFRLRSRTSIGEYKAKRKDFSEVESARIHGQTDPKQMRPRPATRAALLVDAPPAPSPRKAVKCTLTRPHSDRNTRLLTYPRFTSESRRSRKTSSLVLPCEQGPSEEAATPGYPEARRSTLWETSSSSPSRTAETASSAAIFSRRLKHLTHALSALCLNL